MLMPLYIKDDATAELVAQLAKLRGLTKQAAVRLAVQAELDRAREAIDMDRPDDTEVDRLVRTVHRAAEAAAMLRSRVDDAGRPACDPEQQVDPAVVVHLRSQLDQIREAASMAHASYAPSTSIYVLADEILTIARCPQ